MMNAEVAVIVVNSSQLSILRRISLQPHPNQNLSFSFFLPVSLPSLPPPNAHCATGVQHWVEYSNASLQKLNRCMCISLYVSLNLNPHTENSNLSTSSTSLHFRWHPKLQGIYYSPPTLKIKGHVPCRQASSKFMQLYLILILIQPHPQTSPKQKLVQVPTNRHTDRHPTN